MKNKPLFVFFLVTLFAVNVCCARAQEFKDSNSKEATIEHDWSQSKTGWQPREVYWERGNGVKIGDPFYTYDPIYYCDGWRINVPSAPEDNHVITTDPVILNLVGGCSREVRLSVGESWKISELHEGDDTHFGFETFLKTPEYNNNFTFSNANKVDSSIVLICKDGLDTPPGYLVISPNPNSIFLTLLPQSPGNVTLEFEGKIVDSTGATRKVIVDVPVVVME